MHSQKFKYQEYLEKFPNCPPKSYESMNKVGFRWVCKDNLESSFYPLNLINVPPPRVQDNTDLMCKGYGLSLFDTLENAIDRFKALYQKKRNVSHEDFLKDKGDSIAYVNLGEIGTGIYGDLNIQSGHFTFHEYSGIDLSEKVVNITNIFDSHGDFK